MGLEGSIEEFGLADILQLIYFQKKTGVLSVESRLGKIKLYFHSGDVVGTESKKRTEEKRLGKILVKKGLLSDQKLNEFLGKQKSTREKLGKYLIKNGIVAEDEVRNVLTSQMTDAVVQLFNWKKGTYEFLQQKIVVDKDFPVSIDTQHLLMEGLRIVDEWSAIEGKVTLDTVFRKTKKKEQDFTKEEQRIYKYIDGENDVSTIVEISGMEDLEVSRALIALLEKGVIVVAEEKAYIAEAPEKRRKRSISLPVIPVLTSAIIIVSFLVAVGPYWISGHSPRLINAVQRLEELRLKIEKVKLMTGMLPRSLDAISNTKDRTDPWGEAFDYRVNKNGYVLRSSGPDGKLNTEDDIY